MAKHTVVLIPGDGIGPEVTAATKRVVEAAGAGIDHVVTSRTAPGPPAAEGTLTPSHGTWLTVAYSADLPNGAVHPFTVSAVTGFIERADGQLRAVSGVCTHQGCRPTAARNASGM